MATSAKRPCWGFYAASASEETLLYLSKGQAISTKGQFSLLYALMYLTP